KITIGILRLLERELAGQRGEGVVARAEFLQPLQVRFGQFNRGDLAGLEQLSQLGDSRVKKIVGHLRHPPSQVAPFRAGTQTRARRQSESRRWRSGRTKPAGQCWPCAAGPPGRASPAGLEKAKFEK